jgi:hypothetical protein
MLKMDDRVDTKEQERLEFALQFDDFLRPDA